MSMTLREILTTEHLNSRLIYLMTSVTLCACVLLLVVAFIIVQHKDLYPEMIGILLAGGVGSSAGRWMTTNKSKLPPDPDMESKEVTTVSKTLVTGSAPKRKGGRHED